MATRKAKQPQAPYQPWKYSQIGNRAFNLWCLTQGVNANELQGEQADWADKQLDQLDAQYRQILKTQAEQE